MYICHRHVKTKKANGKYSSKNYAVAETSQCNNELVPGVMRSGDYQTAVTFASRFSLSGFLLQNTTNIACILPASNRHTYVHNIDCTKIEQSVDNSYLYTGITKQYNLVPAKEVISLPGKVTAGLVENNGSLPPGL